MIIRHTFLIELRRGAIKNYPMAIIAGKPLATEATVTRRHEDGSVWVSKVTFTEVSKDAEEPVVRYTNQTTCLCRDSGNSRAE